MHSIVLGIIQGISEFLPISSSAHLITIPWLLGWPPHSLTLDVALHVGTLMAVVIYFRKKWAQMASALFQGKYKEPESRLFFQILLATIPGAVIGLLGKSYAETVFRTPILIAATLAFMGIVLWLCDSKSSKTRELTDLNTKDCLIIGLFQGFAIIPGFSRSGTTISAALLLGMKRSAAAEFSFLLSVPIIAGAALLQIPSAMEQQLYSDINFWVGMTVSFLLGYASIAFLLKYVTKIGYLPFAIYRFLLGFVILVYWLY